MQAFERLLADISARFVNLAADRVDAAITDALGQFVLLLGVDRSQLIRYPASSDEGYVTHSWAVEGVPAVSPKPVRDRFPWFIARQRAGQPTIVPDVARLGIEAATDKKTWQEIGVRSNLSMPMRVGGAVVGSLVFACLRRRRDWPDALVERVSLLADVFANALAHKQALEDLQSAIAFETTLSNTLATLLTAAPADRDRAIEAGLRDVAAILRATRVTLWQRMGESEAFRASHRWLHPAMPAGKGAFGPDELPWISSQLVRGEEVRIDSLAQLPDAARRDAETLAALGIASTVVMPLTASGMVVAALSFSSAPTPAGWSRPLLARARLMGEVFAAFIARLRAEQREAEAQERAAHAARVGSMGLFAASLVHELTQPLAASLAHAENAAELLATDAPDLAELRGTVADIVADDRRASELIQQLRRFLRRGDVQRTDVDLLEVIEEALRMIAGQAAEREVEVVRELPPSLPRCIGDRVQLQQVVLNLLLNALDAAAEVERSARRVTLAARASPTGPVMEISDTGRGMDEATRQRVFEPFFTTKHGGMGLGLSIARTIVTSHGGQMEVASAPGRGSSFRFELPAASTIALETPSAPLRCAAADGTVFVVDDDESLCRAIERQLQHAGLAVRTFGSSQRFLEAVTAVEGRACLVSDVRMAGMSGLELPAALARRRLDLPTVFISGHGDPSVTMQAMKAGAVTFLSKPFSKEQLIAAVQDALARSEVIGEARQRRADLQARYATLTPRERDVFALVTEGLPNKVIARRLGTAEATVKIHRGRVMKKMDAGSVTDLVHMAGRLGVSGAADA